jgi:hypothetical protein
VRWGSVVLGIDGAEDDNHQSEDGRRREPLGLENFSKANPLDKKPDKNLHRLTLVRFGIRSSLMSMARSR